MFLRKAFLLSFLSLDNTTLIDSNLEYQNSWLYSFPLMHFIVSNISKLRYYKTDPITACLIVSVSFNGERS